MSFVLRKLKKHGQEKKENTIAAKQQKGRTSLISALNAEGKYHCAKKVNRPWYDISFEEMEILEDD